MHAKWSISCRLCAALRSQCVVLALHCPDEGQQHMLKYFQAQGAHCLPGEKRVLEFS